MAGTGRSPGVLRDLQTLIRQFLSWDGSCHYRHAPDLQLTGWPLWLTIRPHDHAAGAQGGAPALRDNTKAFCRIAAESLDCPGPIYEFGSYQTPGQLDYADLRSLFPGRSFVGCDLRAGPGVDRIADVSEIDLDDNSVGTVLAIETFEHVFEIRRAFDEVFRVLKPGGLFVVTLPLNFRIHGFPEDYWRMTPACLKRMMVHLFGPDLTGFQGYHRFPHTIFGLGIKEPVPVDVSTRLERVSRAFQSWLKQAEADLPRGH